MRKIAGQNLIEYLLLIVTVILVLGLLLNPRSPFAARLETATFKTISQQLNNVNNEIRF